MADLPKKMTFRNRGGGTLMPRGLDAESQVALLPSAVPAVLVFVKGGA
jgi:hypothetical protein